MLNSGLGFSDEFEKEACKYSEKSSSKFKQQYKEFIKSVKDKVRMHYFVVFYPFKSYAIECLNIIEHNICLTNIVAFLVVIE